MKKLSNKYDLPDSLVDVIESTLRDTSLSDPKRVGVTTLIGPPRIRLLTVRHYNELDEDLSEHLWRVFGNAVHGFLASATGNERLVEEKMIEVVDGITVVGKLDLYDNKHKSIEDWKVTSIWSAKLGDRTGWENQLNPYAWFLRKLGFDVEKGFINTILRDWRRGETLKYDDYPRIPFKRIPIKIWSFEQQDKFVKERVAIYKSALTLSDDKLPLCTDEERWKREDSWAVFKDKNKKAARVLKTEGEALEYAHDKFQDGKYRVEFRKGGDLRCSDYCVCRKFCNYYKEHYGQGNEKQVSKKTNIQK